MAARKTVWKTQKTKKSEVSKKTQKETNFKTVSPSKISNDSNVSVFTKTSNPKVIIQTDNINESVKQKNENINQINIIKNLCAIIICLIILITFFLSFKTYIMMNNLLQLLPN